MTALKYIVAQLQNYTIAEIAKGTGLGHNTVQRIRSGNMDNPGYKTVVKLATFLHDKTECE